MSTIKKSKSYYASLESLSFRESGKPRKHDCGGPTFYEFVFSEKFKQKKERNCFER